MQSLRTGQIERMGFPQKDRYWGVEALRFVAAFIVVVTHSTFYAYERNDHTMSVWHFGESGVDIFFVISGFVIVVASAREGGWVSSRSFVARRVKRIIPMYWLATSVNLAILLILPSVVLHSTLDWEQVAKSYLLIPDYNADGRVEPLLGVAWTLYFESFFYVMFAIALAIRVSPYIFVSSILVCLAGASLFRSPQWPAFAVYASPLLLEFLAGMLIARFLTPLRVHRAAAFALILAGAVTLVGFGELGAAVPGIVSRGVPSVFIVAGVVLAEQYIPWQRARWLLFLGAASYAIYLFHPLFAPIAPVALTAVGIQNGPLATGLGVVLAVSLAAIIHRYVEVPTMNRLRHRGRPNEHVADRRTDARIRS